MHHCRNDDDDNNKKKTSIGNPFESMTMHPQHQPQMLQHNHNRMHNLTSHPTLQQSRSYSLTTRTERAPAVAIMALGSVALAAKAGQYAVQGYNEWQKNQPAASEQDGDGANVNAKGDDATASSDSNTGNAKKTAGDQKANNNGARENIFAKYFNVGVGSKYYEGGFEDKMTRREAALILGVRESSTSKRIKEAHRKLLILNHPDTGGSTYLAGKLNEAKDLLLKGKRD